LGLRQLQETLNRRADTVQKEFIAVSDRLKVIGLQLVESREAEHDRLLVEQEELRERRGVIADEVNRWRERARLLTAQGDEAELRLFLERLLADSDDALRPVVQRTILALDEPETVSAGSHSFELHYQPLTGAARLIERARTEYDLRGADPGPRQRAAVEFSQRRGMAQDEAAMAQVEAAVDDPDPIVRELALLTVIQLHRFRALNLADLEAAHESVKRLARINHLAVIPVLIEILAHPRSGFVQGQEERNGNSRMVALTRLIEWHTASAQAAILSRQFDPDPRIVRVALRSLELFPGPWNGPLPSPPSAGN
jgi:hypothetical protein